MHYKFFHCAFHQSWHKSLLISLIRSKHHAEEVLTVTGVPTRFKLTVCCKSGKFLRVKNISLYNGSTTKRSSKVSAWEGEVLCIIENYFTLTLLQFHHHHRHSVNNLNIGHEKGAQTLKEFSSKKLFTDSSNIKKKKIFHNNFFKLSGEV